MSQKPLTKDERALADRFRFAEQLWGGILKCSPKDNKALNHALIDEWHFTCEMALSLGYKTGAIR